MTRPYAVRKLDKLGRIVLPAEMREALDLESCDFAQLHVEEDQIILKKLEPGCCFCGEKKHLQRVHGCWICQTCLKELKEIPL